MRLRPHDPFEAPLHHLQWNYQLIFLGRLFHISPSYEVQCGTLKSLDQVLRVDYPLESSHTRG